MFDPNIPATDSEMKSAEMRNQFNGLKDLIDAIPAPPPETEPRFTSSEAFKFLAGDKAKLDGADTIPARDAAITAAIAGIPAFPAKCRFAGMLVDTTGSTQSALLRAWTRGNFGLTAAPFVEDSDGDTIYCRWDLFDYTDPLVFPNVTVQAFSTSDDGDKEYFTLAAVPFDLIRLYVDDWHRWYVRVRLPRSLGGVAGLAFTVNTP